MESNSEVNRINCSEKSASILRKQWPEVKLFDRGEIPIKGKGHMRCFWVHNAGSTPSLPHSIKEIPEQFPVKTTSGELADAEFVEMESCV